MKEYKSKFDNYDIGQRLDDLKNAVEIQCSKGNYDHSEYMRGMANGLLLAWHIIREPYGAEVPYLKALSDIDSLELSYDETQEHQD